MSFSSSVRHLRSSAARCHFIIKQQIKFVRGFACKCEPMQIHNILNEVVSSFVRNQKIKLNVHSFHDCDLRSLSFLSLEKFIMREKCQQKNGSV